VATLHLHSTNSIQLDTNRRDRHKKEIPGIPRLCVGAVFDAVYDMDICSVFGRGRTWRSWRTGLLCT